MSETETPVALVTGATDGIGKKTGHRSARWGARVHTGARDKVELEGSVTELCASRREADDAAAVTARAMDVRGGRGNS
ncbi:hypothetical protein ACWCZ5_03730 [Streptomyces sp. NPDC001667]